METVDLFILLAGVCSIAFAFLLYKKIAQIVIPGKDGKAYGTVTEYSDEMGKLSEIYDLITNGAKSFLFAEYKICGMFVLGFAAVIFVLITVGSSMKYGALTATAFVLGALTSMAAGYLGMMIAVFSNARCAFARDALRARARARDEARRESHFRPPPPLRAPRAVSCPLLRRHSF